MFKNKLRIALVLVLALSLALSMVTPAAAAGFQAEPLFIKVGSDKNTPDGSWLQQVGVVKMWQGDFEGTPHLFVEYNTEGYCWVITETHLAFATTVAGIPQTKKGNPRPGRFPYKEEYSEPQTVVPWRIPMAEIYGTPLPDPLPDLVVAAQAVVRPCEGNGAETAWGNCLDFPGPRWAHYFVYTGRDEV